MMSSKQNHVLSKWMDQILISHVRPSEEVARAHDAKIKKLMHDMEEELPKQSALFKGCSVELVGSAGGCSTKVGEANEYDLNIILDLPFRFTRFFTNESIYLNFEDSSPTFASIEVDEESVSRVLSDLSLCDIESTNQFFKTSEREDFDIFVKRNNKYVISSEKVRNHFGSAFHNLNRFNSNGSNLIPAFKSNHPTVQQSDCYPTLYQDVMLVENEWGYDYFVHDLSFSVDITCCIRLPLKMFKHHPRIPQAIEQICNLISIPDDVSYATMIPKKSITGIFLSKYAQLRRKVLIA